MLYFDQFSEDRFGTLRQQIWSLLHYPLHMAIVICVEGNTSLIVWNSAVQALRFIWAIQCEDFQDPAEGFNNSTAFIGYLNNSMESVNARFRSKKWDRAYDWNLNLTAINNYTATYGFRSDEWNEKTGDVVRTMFVKAQVFVFEAHADTLAKLNAVTPIRQTQTPDIQQEASDRLDAIYDVFNVTVMSFYISAGAMLLVLAILYWFNKMHKTKYEFGEMINRVVVGFALIIVGVAAVIGDKSTEGFKFVASHWMIAIVVLCFVTGKSLLHSSLYKDCYTDFLQVLFLDNTLLVLSRKTSRRNARRGASLHTSTISTTDTSTANLLPRHPHSRNTSRSPSRSAPLSRVASTINMPLSRTQTFISVPSHHRSCSEASEIPHDIVNSAYHTPSHSHSASEVDQIGIAVSPPLLERNPSRSQNRKVKGSERHQRYESVGWSDEVASEGEDLRRLGRSRMS